jgi:hypothetical protein
MNQTNAKPVHVFYGLQLAATWLVRGGLSFVLQEAFLQISRAIQLPETHLWNKPCDPVARNTSLE